MKKYVLFLLNLLLITSCSNTNIAQSSSSNINSSISSEVNISIYDTIKDNCGTWYVNDIYFNDGEGRNLFLNSLGETSSIEDNNGNIAINNFAFAMNVDSTDSVSYEAKGRISFGTNDLYKMIGNRDESTKEFFNKYGIDVYYYKIDNYDGILIPTIKSVTKDEIIISYNLYHCEGEDNLTTYIYPGYYDIHSVDENSVNTLNVVLNKNISIDYLKGNYNVSSIATYDENGNSTQYDNITYSNFVLKVNDNVNIDSSLNFKINNKDFNRVISDAGRACMDYFGIEAPITFYKKDDNLYLSMNISIDENSYYVKCTKI